jgi:hypothetical protein
MNNRKEIFSFQRIETAARPSLDWQMRRKDFLSNTYSAGSREKTCYDMEEIRLQPEAMGIFCEHLEE